MLIIAILSVLVTFTGSHFWDLIAFICFWMGVSSKPRSSLRHKMQVIIRNVTSPGAVFLATASVGRPWGSGRHHTTMFKLFSLAALAMLCSSGVLVAGIFVSQVVSTSDIHVLARSESCGWTSWRNESTDLSRDYQETVFNQAVTYVQTCYNQTAGLSAISQCKSYVKEVVPIHAMTHTACPFPGICKNVSAVKLDTGLIDSNDVFGINTPREFRIKMQKVFTCAPIDVDKYFTAKPIPPEFSRRYYARDPLSGEQMFEWYLGPMAGNLSLNATVWQSNYAVKFSSGLDLTPRSYYVPADNGTLTGWHTSTFHPIPLLRREDADTHIIAFHNNALGFYAPTDDPIFEAHTRQQITFDNDASIPMYSADKPASFLSCAEQMRFCFPQKGCTRLLSAASVYVKARNMAPSSQQNATLRYLFFQTPNFYEAPRAPLLATRNPISYQLGIPPNQWETEVQAWVRFLVAVTQTSITHIAAGPGIVRPDFDQLAEPLEWPGICSRQRMGAPDGYSNINVLALALGVGLSGFIILINLCLIPILKYLYWRHGLFQQLIESWNDSDMLQFQRKVNRDAGDSTWQDRDTIAPNANTTALATGFGTPGFETDIGGAGPVGSVATQHGKSTLLHITSPPRQPSSDTSFSPTLKSGEPDSTGV